MRAASDAKTLRFRDRKQELAGSMMHEARIAALQLLLAGSLAQNKARSALSVLAIALGVALGYAVQLITGAAVNELALGVQFLSGEADLQVRGPRGGFDEGIYPELARLAGG